MSSGERPIGAAKGKQSDTEALCQTPPPPRALGVGPVRRGPQADRNRPTDTFGRAKAVAPHIVASVSCCKRKQNAGASVPIKRDKPLDHYR